MPASLRPVPSRTASGTETPMSSAPSSSDDPDRPIAHPRLAALAREKYLLQVTAGPSYDASTHVPLRVNDCGAGTAPARLENEFVRAAVRVRIRDYRGLPLASPAGCAYFEHASRVREQYSIGFSFVPKVDIPADEAIWGNDFDHPIRDRLPPGFGVAVRIVKNFVDPSIELDAYADEPWMYAPALCSFFSFRVGEKRDEWGDIPVAGDEEPLAEGADGDGEQVREESGMPGQAGRRKRWFRSRRNREGFVFEKGRLYQADFFNPYIDFANFALKLPGFSINCIRYINDKTHKLRYVFKNGRTGDLYFCVVLTLLHGADLDEAVRTEDKRWVLENDANAATDDETVNDDID